VLDTKQSRDVVATSWQGTLDRLSALQPDAWSTPTRLHGWTVRDLVAHNIWSVSMEVDAIRRARAGIADPAQGQSPPVAGQDFAPIWIAALQTTVNELLAALDATSAADESEDRLVPLAAAALPWSTVIDVFAFEAAIHADDLRAALTPNAPRPELAPDALRATADFVGWFFPVLTPTGDEPAPEAGRGIHLRGNDGLFDLAFHWDGTSWQPWQVWERDNNPPLVTIVGSDSDVARVALGRLPVTDPAIEIDGSIEAAESLKSWFPGP
jgi:uncharacterized protein (TIGR03083 family)